MNDQTPPTANDDQLAAYELPADRPDALPAPDDAGQDALPTRALLRQHAVWFCQLRWIVAGVLAAVGLAACLPAWPEWFGAPPPPAWLLACAAALAAVNIGYGFILKRLPANSQAGSVRAHLWCQVVVDLIVLTAVVHAVGGTVAYAPVAYLFHIVLACIFFSPGESLGVTAVSAVLFGSLVLFQTAGVLPGPGNLAAPSDAAGFSGGSGRLWQLGALLAVWAVIWYLASRLTAELRQRTRELAAVNLRLEASSAERTSHMLQTTHQLKAPFAAIHANAQLLLNGYAGPLSEQARAVIEKIATRAQTLSRQIQEMLQLANLRSRAQAEPSLKVFNLQEVVQREVERIGAQAALRGVSLETNLEPVLVRGSDDYLVMLIDNLLNNAVNYSYDGGWVEVRCGPGGPGMACLVIRDHGIGIPADKLPHVFEDYYRTTEATRHNKSSTGLGLAIVRLVARTLQATVRIESSPRWGTRVTLRMPAVPDDKSFAQQGVSHGVFVDRR